MKYSMTSSTNFKLTNLFTQETICEDKTQTRNQTLMKMFNASISKIMEKCPHCPDYIIITYIINLYINNLNLINLYII